MIFSLIDVFCKTCQYFIAHWSGNQKKIEEIPEQIQLHFMELGSEKVLILNPLWMWILVTIAMNNWFSADFVNYIHLYVAAPHIVISWLYYYRQFKKAIWNISFNDLQRYGYNFLFIMPITMVSICFRIFTLMLMDIIFVVVPEQYKIEIKFPISVFEEWFPDVVTFSWMFTIFLICLVKFWKSGYDMYMEFINRKQSISKTQLVCDILYFGAGLPIFFIQTQICLMVYSRGIHTIHFVFIIVEVFCGQTLASIRFEVIHQLAHSITQVYDMTHKEHHIPPSIHPNTSGVGLFERLVHGGSGTLFMNMLSHIPFYALWSLFIVNLITHSMAPVKMFMSIHVYHHLANSDVYSANRPSKNALQHSVFLKKYFKKMNQISVCGQAAFAMFSPLLLLLVIVLLLHYIFGLSPVKYWKKMKYF